MSVGDEIERFVQATAPDPEDRRALKTRVLDHLDQTPPRRVPVARWVAAAGGALAAAAALAFWLQPTPAEPVRITRSEDAQNVQEHVVVWADGEGWATDGHIQWTHGAMRVEVTPHRGVRLEVQTEEATITVVGTVFEVERDTWGTVVRVSRGEVSVLCSGGPPRALSPEQEVRCFSSAETGVGYVLAAQRRGDPPAVWLAAIEDARRSSFGHPDTNGALLDLEVDALLGLGRIDDAVARARQDLPIASDQTLSAVAATLVEADRCAEARPFLLLLAEHGNDDASAWLARCSAR